MKNLLTAALGLAFSASALASTVTLTFQEGVNGYVGTQDTMIRSNETATGSGQSSSGDSRGLAFGNLDFISIDGDDGSPGSKPNQGLIRFDNLFGSLAGQIAANATIVSAKLTLTVFDVGSGMNVHTMLTSWSESSSWNSMTNGIQANGSEASASAIASFGANNSSANVPTGNLVVDVTGSLQGMQASGTNYGWALIPFVSGTNGIDFRSSEYATANLRPLLTVEVMPVPEPEAYAMFLAGLGLMGVVARRRQAK